VVLLDDLWACAFGGAKIDPRAPWRHLIFHAFRLNEPDALFVPCAGVFPSAQNTDRSRSPLIFDFDASKSVSDLNGLGLAHENVL
jgi:hypothetical protein